MTRHEAVQIMKMIRTDLMSDGKLSRRCIEAFDVVLDDAMRLERGEVHHRDGEPTNNDVSNLEVRTAPLYLTAVARADQLLTQMENRSPQLLLNDAEWAVAAERVCAQVGGVKWCWSDWGGIEFYAA